MANIDGWLAKKYQILGEQADAQSRLAGANVGAIEQQTRLAPAEASARNFAARGAGAGSFAQANLTNTNAYLAPSLAAADIASRYAGVNLSGIQGAVLGSEGLDANPFLGQEYWNRKTLGGTAPGGGGEAPVASGPLVPNGSGGFTNGPMAGVGFARGGGGTISGPFAGSGSTISASGGNEGSGPAFAGGSGTGRTRVDMGPRGFGYSAGTTRVNAPGDGTVDTQRAELADGEAVLNKGAAEHLGRGTIELLNAIGAVKMGLVVGDARGDGAKGEKSPSRVQAQEGATPGYAWGTSNVAAPGQTVTNGSWDPAEAAAQLQTQSTPPPPPPAQPQAGGFGKRLVPPAKPVPGYAKGTARVSVKGSKEAKTAPVKGDAQGAGLTPEIIQAVLGMGGQMGGRGMPPPSTQPMPMSMPSTGGRN